MAIEIDKVMLEIAQKYFELKVNDRLEVVIDDGLRYIKECRTKNAGKQFDAVLFDVDSKDLSVGMSCPPAEFIEHEVLNNIKELIGPDGLFILNLVCRNDALRTEVISDLKKIFPAVCNHKLNEYLNEVIYCSNNELFKTSGGWQTLLLSSAKELNEAIKNNITEKSELLDIQELMSNLTI